MRRGEWAGGWVGVMKITSAGRLYAPFFFQTGNGTGQAIQTARVEFEEALDAI